MIKKRGFVALVDILGFSDRVARDAELGGLDRYIDTVLSVINAYGQLRVILFSDTVVIYSLGDSEDDYAAVTKALSRLSHQLLMQEVPLRGALAFGPFARSEQDQHGTVVAGQPIIEAHYFESRLQWIGVMLAPSVLRQLPDLASRTGVSGPGTGESPEAYFARASRAAIVQHCSGIPVESNGVSGTLEGYAIVPLADDAVTPEAIRTCMSTVLAKLRWLKQLAPEPRAQSKYANSVAWLEPLYQDWIMTLR